LGFVQLDVLARWHWTIRRRQKLVLDPYARLRGLWMVTAREGHGHGVSARSVGHARRLQFAIATAAHARHSIFVQRIDPDGLGGGNSRIVDQPTTAINACLGARHVGFLCNSSNGNSNIGFPGRQAPHRAVVNPELIAARVSTCRCISAELQPSEWTRWRRPLTTTCTRP